MRSIFLLLITVIVIGCSNMNTHKNYKEAHIEKYFQGDNVAMAEAIFNEDTDEITRLVKQEGYDVNTRDSIERGVWTYQWTYLNYAVTKGKRKSVKALLNLGADIDALLFIGSAHSNLNIAAGHCDQAMIKLLLDYNVKMDHIIASSPLDDLMVNDCYSEGLFDLLIEHGTGVNHPEYISGSTPLITAYAIRNEDAIDYLLSRGADPLQIRTSGSSFASTLERDISSNRNIKTAQKYKQRMMNDYNIQYPIEVSYRKGIEQSIKRYEKATAVEKQFLGASELERVSDMRESLITGIYNDIAID